MKKNDYICLILSILINILIVLALTVFSNYDPEVKTDEIKIGLVDFETDASTQFKGEKNADAKEKNLDATSIEKKEEPKQEIKEEIKKEEEKIEEKPKEIEKEKVVEKAEKDEKAEKIVSEKIEPEKKEQKKKPSLADLKKQINQSQPKMSPDGGYSPSDDTEEVVDRILQNVSYTNGLVSGSKMGNSAGGLITSWNDKNKVPDFPQSAKASGKHGRVKIRLKVDKNGNVLSYFIEEGSGVPEIDAALERVIGTWRVQLKKGGKPINGTFPMIYNFEFRK